jgi:hypothetical protein
MIYDLMINAVKQALQLQQPDEMSSQELGKMLGVLYFLQSQKITPQQKENLEKIALKLERETFKREYSDILMVLVHLDSELSMMISQASPEERLWILNLMLEYDAQQSGLPISAQKRAELEVFFASL